MNFMKFKLFNTNLSNEETGDTKFAEYLHKIHLLEDENEIHEEMKLVYDYIKRTTTRFFEKKDKISYYFLIGKLMEIERYLPMRYIIDEKPNFIFNEEFQKLDNTTYFNSVQEVLDYIVYETRDTFMKKIKEWGVTEDDLFDIDLSNECINISKIVESICTRLHIKCYLMKIYPGFSYMHRLFNGNGFHYFNLVIIDNQKYIVDCSYSQFFWLRQSMLERTGILGVASATPGRFMTLNDSRLETAKTILRDGWIKADEINLKNYLDGFALSFRNGLFYENLGAVDYSTPYTYEDYMNFLTERDNQINHEGLEFLGRQNKPLKDYTLDFSPKSKL